MRNKWFIKPESGGLIQISYLKIEKNIGTFTTLCGLQDTNILVCYNEEHRIKITNVEPLTYNLLEILKNNNITIIGDFPNVNTVIEGWAIYNFEFIDFDQKIIDLYEKYIKPNTIQTNLTHPINVIKSIQSIMQEYYKPSNLDN